MLLCLALPETIRTVPGVIIKSALRRLHTEDATITYDVVAANLFHSHHQRRRRPLHLHIAWVVLFSQLQERNIKFFKCFGRPLGEFCVYWCVWIFRLHAALTLAFLLLLGGHLAVAVVNVWLLVIVNGEGHHGN